MKTEPQARSEFAAYFLDLQADARASGAAVDRATEWEFFLQAEIEEGNLPASATAWKCPRSLKNLVNH